MPNSKIKISFNIDAWTANSLGLSQPDEWKEWAASGNWPQDGKVNVADIPAMMRRRMSPLSKLAVQTAIELLKQHQVDYLVFSSRHGELHRSVALVADIISGEEASPMAVLSISAQYRGRFSDHRNQAANPSHFDCGIGKYIPKRDIRSVAIFSRQSR